MKIIPQIVKVRKHEVDTKELATLLRNSRKGKSKQEIAEYLGISESKVAHWFRNDKYFAIPDEEYWFELKAFLGIKDNRFDLAITEFEYRFGVYEKDERCYEPSDISPSILSQNKTINIIEYEQT